MINYADVTQTTRYHSQGIVSTLDGSIQLQQSRARLVVSDASGVEKTVQDVDGFHVNDESGNEMTLLDQRGLNTIDPDTGTYRGRWGIATTDNRPFGGFSKDGEDIRTLLGE